MYVVYMKKQTVLKVIIFILFAGRVIAAADKIQISQIKLVIDNSEFSWKEEGIKPVNENQNSRLLPETVLSYTNLKPGKFISLKNLEKEVKESELRIIASGLVYSAKVLIVPARKNPEKRTVLIQVQSGFFPRFGGGGYYGVYGCAGLGGKRMEVLGFAGWNLNGVSWKYENAFNLPLILGTSLFWDGPAAFVESENYSSVNGLLTAGFFMGADNRFCIDLTSGYSFGKDFMTENITIKPYFESKKFFSENLISEFCTQAIFQPFYNVFYFRAWDSVYSVNWSPVHSITLASSLGAGIGNNNLFENNNGLSSNSCFSNMIIRSGYSQDELIGSEYLYSSLESRWNATTVSFSPVVKMKIQPFAYMDLAVIDEEIREAVGGGIRLLLDNPIFAYFTFSYGVNFEGQGRFIFTATKGY